MLKKGPLGMAEPLIKPLDRIWLIDDDPINNLVCERVLRANCFAMEVAAYQEAELALTQLMDLDPLQRPELIFLDINMPVMNGWDFLDEFEPWNQQLCLPIKIVMLSSSIFLGDREKSKQYPSVFSYLEKPLRLNALETVKKLMAGTP